MRNRINVACNANAIVGQVCPIDNTFTKGGCFHPLSLRERGRERGRYGIVLPSSVTLLRFRVGARNDVREEVLMNSLFPLSHWERVSEGQERVERVIARL